MLAPSDQEFASGFWYPFEIFIFDNCLVFTRDNILERVAPESELDALATVCQQPKFKPFYNIDLVRNSSHSSDLQFLIKTRIGMSFEQTGSVGLRQATDN